MGDSPEDSVSDGSSFGEEEEDEGYDDDESVTSASSGSSFYFALAGAPGRLGQDKLRQGAQAAGDQAAEQEEAISDDDAVAAISLLRDGDGVVREQAVSRLGRCGQGRQSQAQPALLRSISDVCWQVRRAALQAIAQVGTPGDLTVLEACAAALPDGIWQVRREVVRSLLVLGKHSGLAIQALGQLVSDWRPEVALEAIAALPTQVSRLQRVDAAGALGAGVQHRNPGVRDAAIAALRKLAGVGHASASLRLDVAQAAGAAAVAALEHTDEEIRESGVRALVALGRAGADAAAERLKSHNPPRDALHSCVLALAKFAERDSFAAAALSEGFLDDDALVRRCALDALRALPKGQHSLVLEAVYDRWGRGEGHWQRIALIHALIVAARPGDKQAIELLAACLEDHERPDIQRLASDALEALGQPFDSHALESVAKRLEHRDPRVREAAEGTLPRMAYGGGNAPMSGDEPAGTDGTLPVERVPAGEGLAAQEEKGGLVSILAAERAQISAALEAEAGEVARTVTWQGSGEGRRGGDPQAVPIVATRLAHADGDVRQSAADALEAVASCGGDADAIRLTVELFEHADAGVRDDAVVALSRVAHLDMDQAFKLTKTHLMSPLAEAREAAVKAIGFLAEPGDQVSRDLLLPILVDDAAAVRQAAVAALVRICSLPGEVAAQCVARVAGALPSLTSAPLRLSHFQALLGVAEAACEEHAAQFCCDIAGGAAPHERDGVLWMERNAAIQAALEAASVVAAGCLEDSDAEVRGLALETLARLRRTGARRVIKAVALRLTNFFQAVRQAAVEGLRIVAKVGDTFAISAAAVFVEHRDWEVRRSALDALACLVDEPQLLSTVAALAALADTRDEASWAKNAPAIRGVLERFCQSSAEAGGREGRQRDILAVAAAATQVFRVGELWSY